MQDYVFFATLLVSGIDFFGPYLFKNIQNFYLGAETEKKMASKEISDLPAEIIDKINKLLPSLQDKKNFREVCLLSPQLRELYRDVLFYGDDDDVILNVNVDIRKNGGISAEDLQIVMNSSRNVKLTFHYFKSENAEFEQYKAAILNFVNNCNDRITQIKITSGFAASP